MSEVDPMFSFDSGRRSLDFMATASGFGLARSADRISDPGALALWLRRGLAVEPEGIGEAALDLAHELRAAMFAVVRPAAAGGPTSAPAVRHLNACAAYPVAVPQLDPGDGRVQTAGVVGIDECLALLARDLIDLLAGEESELLRECEAADCTGIYIDRSRGRRRRWCSAERCGNRARVAAHRSRAEG